MIDSNRLLTNRQKMSIMFLLGGEIMKYLTVKEVANKWGYSESTIRKWCQQGLIKVTIGAEKKNGRWQIPADTKCPKKLK